MDQCVLPRRSLSEAGERAIRERHLISTMPRGPSRPLTTQEVFAALTEAAVDGDLDESGGGVAPETLASASRLNCPTAAVRRHLIDLLAAGYAEGRYGRCPETGFPRQSFLPSTAIRSASDVY